MPVSAADSSGTMLYNGVELPNIETVWTGDVKETYPYAYIRDVTSNAGDYSYVLFLSEEPAAPSTSGEFYLNCTYLRYLYLPGSSYWTFDKTASNKPVTSTVNPMIWANVDMVFSSGNIYLAASVPVDPNAPSAPTGNIEVVSSQVLDDSVSFVLSLSDLTETSDVYSVRVSRYIGETLDSEFDSEVFSSSTGSLHLTAANLTPETEYRFVFTLLISGEATEITAETTVTTLAGGGEVLPDYSGQLGEIQESLGDVQEGIGAVKDSVDGVKDSVDGVQEAVTDVKEEVASLPQKIATAILDGIKSLFIPSEEDLTQIKTEYEDMLAEKLGFIWQAFDLLTTFVGDLQSSLEDGQAYEFVFPGIKFPMQGEELVLIPETPVSLENGLMDVLRPVLGTIVSAIAVIAFVNMAHDYVLAIVSGISAYEFERRKG